MNKIDHARSNRAAQRQSGFTLTEVVVTVAVAGILASLAVPSFSSSIATQRAKAASSDLYVTLSKARSEAVKRNANVTVAPKSGGWQNGWQIKDAADNVLDDRGAVSGLTVTGPASIVFRSSGRISGTSEMQLTIVDSGYGSAARCVSVDPSGRPYTKEGTTC
ncbi:MAG: GspH/FimT family protein [Pseudomonadota bacterium]